jgi:hypothetical protein
MFEGVEVVRERCEDAPEREVVDSTWGSELLLSVRQASWGHLGQ